MVLSDAPMDISTSITQRYKSRETQDFITPKMKNCSFKPCFLLGWEGDSTHLADNINSSIMKKYETSKKNFNEK